MTPKTTECIDQKIVRSKQKPRTSSLHTIVLSYDSLPERRNFWPSRNIFNHLQYGFCKVSKKDDKVDLNESSTKYTKIYLNSNISSFQFRKVWCCLHWVKLRFYDLFAAESVSQQCWSKWATKLKFCWVFSNQQQNLRAKRTGNFSFGIFF